MQIPALATLSLLLTLTSSIPTRKSDQISILPHEIRPSSAIHDTLVAHQIIGDVLSDFEPAWSIDLVYPSSHSHDQRVLLGNDIPTSSVQSRPIFTFHSTSIELEEPESRNSIFTLVLSDPDATSRENPKKAEMCHWIMTNLSTPISDPPLFELPLDFSIFSPSVDGKSGELVEYLPPSPPPKTGPHRYVFVLLESKKTSEFTKPKERPHWGYGPGKDGGRHGGVEDWADDNGLKVVGANFFYAQNVKQ